MMVGGTMLHNGERVKITFARWSKELGRIDVNIKRPNGERLALKAHRPVGFRPWIKTGRR